MLVTTFQHNIDRLHIQGHRWGNEALHGVLDLGTTSWPSPIGVAASYNKSLFFALGSAERSRSRLLEYDSTLGEGEPNFVQYDYRQPCELPAELKGS